jgi:hypothetical protein
MSLSPVDVEVKLADVLKGWALVPTKQFLGMTLDQFKLAIKPSLDHRANIVTLEAQMTQEADDRDDADKVSYPLALRVVDAVKGDKDLGPDSAVYEAMGYVRKSERASGKTNKTPPQKPATP